MVTQTRVETVRQGYGYSVTYLRRDFTYADAGVQLTIGKIPSGAVILKPISGVNVHTAFNDSGTDYLDIGVSSNDDLYGTDLDLSSAGFIPLDEAVSYYVAADTTLTFTYSGQNSNASAGVGQIVIAFIADDDL